MHHIRQQLRSSYIVWIALLTGCAPAARQSVAMPAKPASPCVWSSKDLVVVDSSHTPLPIDKTVPRYPPDERARRVEVAFVAVIILDTLGRVELPSVSFVGDVPVAFAHAVCDFYKATRFAPVASRSGGATRALVVYPWTFAITGGAWDGKTIDANPVRDRLQKEGAVIAIKELEPLPHCASD